MDENTATAVSGPGDPKCTALFHPQNKNVMNKSSKTVRSRFSTWSFYVLLIISLGCLFFGMNILWYSIDPTSWVKNFDFLVSRLPMPPGIAEIVLGIGLSGIGLAASVYAFFVSLDE